MTRGALTRPALRLLATLLLVLGVALNIGLMPASGASGGRVLVLCTGEGPLQMVADPATGTLHPAAPDPRKASACDWAAGDGHATVPAPLAWAGRPAGCTAARPWAEVVWRARRKASAVWARGPPPPV